MKPRKLIFLALLLAAALAAIPVVRLWLGTTSEQAAAKASAASQSGLVNQETFAAAQRLATLAVTPDEQDFARQAVQLADHELDLAYASGLRNATKHPAPPTPEAQAILTHIKELEAHVKPEQDEVARLKAAIAKAPESQKQAHDEELQLQQALLDVDQEELDAAKQELIRAGGDPQSVVQQLMDQHEMLHQMQGPAGNMMPTASADNSQQDIEEPASRSIVAQFRAWLRLDQKRNQLVSAQSGVNIAAVSLARQRDVLQSLDSAGVQSAPPDDSSGSGASALFPALKEYAEQKQDLAEVDRRTQDLQQLNTLYGSWAALTTLRMRGFAATLTEDLLWIFALILALILVDPFLRFLFSRVSAENKRLRIVRAVVRFAVQAIGVVLILLVILGPPSQLATFIALAGAGLTVALKDFIVGFFGWFALMGRNGIRPGDWVEIEGVGGEVLEVGLLRTVILETGNGSEAGHPTGRKVAFVNSFAIEGHYFNFSTSGQWLWDEIQLPIPASADPYPIAEALQKIVAEETQANAKVAEQEWQHAVPSDVGRSFSAAPAISVRPTGSGVNLIVRFISRAQERHEIRTRLYQKMVEILRQKQIPSPGETPESLPVSS